ncbi:MAG: hypothetical protein HFG26_03545 [Provencibacterium sp.]|jgi:hypothetical protein|nr:hypothetical protein [Provencibacterium sp.]
MILHSIAPLSWLLPSEGNPQQETLPADGLLLEGRRTPEGFRVDRLLSTDPAAYLDARYAPGSLLPLHAAEKKP